LKGNTSVPLHLRTGRPRERAPRPAKHRVTDRDRRQIEDLYVSGLSSLDVAERVGVGKATVLSVLRERGVAIRPQGRRLH